MSFITQVHTYDSVADGEFGAMMQVHIQNDGPVTIEIESPVPITAAHATPKAKTESSTISS